MRLERPTFDAVLHVAERMREWDRREIFAARWNDDPFPLAAECMTYGEFTWIAALDEPIAFIGAAPMHPGVWSVLMFATDDFRRIRLSLTKHVVRVMIPALVEIGAHRAECHSLEGHDDAHDWLKLLGAQREGVRPGFGKNGEDFVCFSWRRPHVHRR